MPCIVPSSMCVCVAWACILLPVCVLRVSAAFAVRVRSQPGGPVESGPPRQRSRLAVGAEPVQVAQVPCGMRMPARCVLFVLAAAVVLLARRQLLGAVVGWCWITGRGSAPRWSKITRASVSVTFGGWRKALPFITCRGEDGRPCRGHPAPRPAAPAGED